MDKTFIYAYFFQNSGRWNGLQGYAHEENEAAEKSCGGKNFVLLSITKAKSISF